MKIADIIGFTAILAGGWYIGQHSGSWVWYDFVIILGLLAIGFYFAVILS